ncbi:SDR family NAD(P)-dependent oxidoreductase [Brucella anthropi]|uniref:SDR family NAD(P)-dependent oxidoreductase n=1 Tax=Brucella anthropi TaxID=529 RepID=UPI0002889648|nr:MULTISPECIES: 3-oxoacyl-ACP reductase family protein [Brucella/Ochrobactrum group]MCR5944271.1 3-oxoacyl-ACP reductase FabG [Ochrobactrum sp. XJ1]
MSAEALNGKVAFITGGSRGIGAAIARRLAKDGATVVVTYVNGKEKAEAVVSEIVANGGKALALKADNRDASQIAAAIEKAVKDFGRLDILVNSAGIWHAAPLEEVTLADFDEVMAVNFRAVFAAVSAATPHLGAGGRVITIGSNLAESVPWPGISLYAASKAALIGLTKGLARDLGPKGVTVNVVQPGSTDTDMNPATGEHAEQQRELIATGSFGSPDDIASLVAWLASPEGRFVSGATLTIDGGTNA